MDQKTVRVEGIPTVIPLERVKDKLTIHFLRARNGGVEIENIELDPGPPVYALITFEDAKAFQRVLNVKDHILIVNGERFRLRVTSHSSVLNPDEIFLKVSMIVDCRKLPEGFRNTLKSQCKQQKDIEFQFDMKEELCSIAGTYTKLLAFSNNILKTLGIAGTNLKESYRHHMNDDNNFTTGDAQNLKQQLSSSILETKRAKEHYETGSGPESQNQRPTPRSQIDSMKLVESDDIRALVKNPLSEDTIDHLEDFSLVMDSDIYLYMQTFKKTEYQKILCQYNVEAVDVGSEGITTLYLQVGSQLTGDIGLLTQAHFELMSLYVELQTSLRKEQISKAEIKCDKQTLKTLPGDLQKMCPLLLCHEDESHLNFIGNVVDVSQAKQYIQELQIMTPSKYPFATQEPLRSTSSMGRQRFNSGGLLETKHYSPRQSRSSSMKIESKGEQKLAANFSIPKSHFSSLEQNDQVEEDVKLAEQKYPFDDKLRHADSPPKTSDFLASLSRIGYSSTNTTAMARPPTDDADVHRKYSKDGNRTKGTTYPKKLDSLSTVDREKEINIPKSTRKSENTGPMKAYSSSSVSYSLAGLSLLDTTKTIIDYKPSEARSTFRRSNSFSSPKSKESDASDKPPKTVSAELKDNKSAKDHQTIDAEISVDNLIWSYLKDVFRSNIEEICRQCGLQIREKKESDITVLTLNAMDKSKLDSAKQHIESLYHQESTNLGSHLFNYHQLGVEGPHDETLNEWCCVFQKCSDKVRFKKEKNKLRLLFPVEVRAKIIEEYNAFFEKQRKLQSLKIIGNNITNEEQDKEDSVKEGTILIDAKYNFKDYDSQISSLSHADSSEVVSGVSEDKQPKERELMEGLVASIQQFNSAYAENNCRLQPTDGQESENNFLVLKTDNFPRNMDIESGKDSQQANISNPNHYLEQERTNPTSFVSEFQKYDKQAVDADTGKVARALPDKFKMLKNNRNNDSEYTTYASEFSPQSLPIGLFGTQQSYSFTKTVNEQAELTSTLGLGSQTEHVECSSPTRKLEHTMEDPKTKHQTGSPSLEQVTQTGRAKKCDQCKKLHGYLFKNPCGHALCTDCFSPSDTCHICLRFSLTNSESVIKGTMSVTTMAMSLDGYNHDPSFKIVYEIANGIQGPKDPNPGQPYEGGRFDTYLPDNKEGRKILQLLKKAFDEGHTFKIRSFGSTARVAWNTIPHKTSIDGGKSKNGYPDAQYLKTVLKQLKDLHIE